MKFFKCLIIIFIAFTFLPLVVNAEDTLVDSEMVQVEWCSAKIDLNTHKSLTMDIEIDTLDIDSYPKQLGEGAYELMFRNGKISGNFDNNIISDVYDVGVRSRLGINISRGAISIDGRDLQQVGTIEPISYNKIEFITSKDSKIYNVIAFENGLLNTYYPYYSYRTKKYYLARFDAWGNAIILGDGTSVGAKAPAQPDDLILMDYRLYSTNSYATKMSSTGSTSVRVPSSSILGSIGSANITGQVTENNSGWTTSLEFKPTNQGSNEIKCQNNANGMVCDVVQWPTYSDTLINKPTSTNNHKYNLTVGTQNVQFNVSAHTEEGSFNSNNVVTDVAFDAILELRFNQRVSGVVKFTVSMPNSESSEIISIRLNEESFVQYNFGTLSNYPIIRYVNISDLKAVKNISVSDEEMQDLTEHGNDESQQSESTLDGTSSNFNDVTSKFDDLESGSLDSFQNSMNDIDLDDFDISSNANLSASAKWLNAQVNSVTRDNAFGALLGFSLVVGICLLIIGRIL